MNSASFLQIQKEVTQMARDGMKFILWLFFLLGFLTVTRASFAQVCGLGNNLGGEVIEGVLQGKITQGDIDCYGKSIGSSCGDGGLCDEDLAAQDNGTD